MRMKTNKMNIRVLVPRAQKLYVVCMVLTATFCCTIFVLDIPLIYFIRHKYIILFFMTTAGKLTF